MSDTVPAHLFYKIFDSAVFGFKWLSMVAQRIALSTCSGFLSQSSNMQSG